MSMSNRLVMASQSQARMDSGGIAEPAVFVSTNTGNVTNRMLRSVAELLAQAARKGLIASKAYR